MKTDIKNKASQYLLANTPAQTKQAIATRKLNKTLGVYTDLGEKLSAKLAGDDSIHLAQSKTYELTKGLKELSKQALAIDLADKLAQAKAESDAKPKLSKAAPQTQTGIVFTAFSHLQIQRQAFALHPNAADKAAFVASVKEQIIASIGAPKNSTLAAQVAALAEALAQKTVHTGSGDLVEAEIGGGRNGRNIKSAAILQAEAIAGRPMRLPDVRYSVTFKAAGNALALIGLRFKQAGALLYAGASACLQALLQGLGIKSFGAKAKSAQALDLVRTATSSTWNANSTLTVDAVEGVEPGPMRPSSVEYDLYYSQSPSPQTSASSSPLSSPSSVFFSSTAASSSQTSVSSLSGSETLAAKVNDGQLQTNMYTLTNTSGTSASSAGLQNKAKLANVGRASTAPAIGKQPPVFTEAMLSARSPLERVMAEVEALREQIYNPRK